jgi:transcription elongation factor Elf1
LENYSKQGGIAMEGYERQTWPDCPRCGCVQGVPAKSGEIYTCTNCGTRLELAHVWIAYENDSEARITAYNTWKEKEERRTRQ